MARENCSVVPRGIRRPKTREGGGRERNGSRRELEADEKARTRSVQENEMGETGAECAHGTRHWKQKKVRLNIHFSLYLHEPYRMGAGWLVS